MLAKEKVLEERNKNSQIYNLINDNYGKGNFVDGVMTLLLSQESMNKLDQSLINLNIKNVEFETLLEKINHQEGCPEMYETNTDNSESIPALQNISQVLKEIQKNIKLSLIELSNQKSNLIKVHEIYINKFKKKMNGSKAKLDEISRRTLIDSLNMTQNKSINKKANNVKTETNKPFKNIKESALNGSFRSISEKTENLKSVLSKSDPDTRKAILRSIETKLKLAQKMY